MDLLSQHENELSGVIEELDDLFPDPKQSEKDYDSLIRNKYDEVITKIKNYRKLIKDKERLQKETQKMDTVLEKAASSIAICDSRTKQLLERVSKKSKLLEREKSRLDSGASVWQMMGLNCTILETKEEDENQNVGAKNDNKATEGEPGDDIKKVVASKGKMRDGNYSFDFTKFTKDNQKKVYSVKVKIDFKNSKNGSCFKIYESNPSDLLSSPEIDHIETTAESDPRHLIVLLHSHITTKFNH